MDKEDRLIGGGYINNKWGISSSTRNRYIKAGTIPKPDVPAKNNGKANKWLKSTIDNAFAEYLGGVTT